MSRGDLSCCLQKCHLFIFFTFPTFCSGDDLRKVARHQEPLAGLDASYDLETTSGSSHDYDILSRLPLPVSARTHFQPGSRETSVQPNSEDNLESVPERGACHTSLRDVWLPQNSKQGLNYDINTGLVSGKRYRQCLSEPRIDTTGLNSNQDDNRGISEEHRDARIARPRETLCSLDVVAVPVVYDWAEAQLYYQRDDYSTCEHLQITPP